MENPSLLKLHKKLKDYFSYFKDDNILAVSENKETLPFVFVICDENYKDYFVLSLALDCPHVNLPAEIALWAAKIKPTILTDNFYISKAGITYYGEEADKYFWIDKNYPIEEIEPENESIN